MGNLPIIEKKPGTPRTSESWKSGELRYDHSNDAEQAKKENPAAEARLDTKRRLALAKIARRSDF